MKFFRIDLLTLLISLFILGSCKNPDGIGLPVDPSNALQTTLIDTATILATTVPDDSVLTSNITTVPLAFFKDPIFGTTEANIATSLNLPGQTTYTPPTGTIVVDSALMVLKYAGGFYGDSLTTNYKVNVYQLTEPIVSTKAYYNNKVWGYNANNLLGSLSFYPRPNRVISITDIVTGAKDTLKKVTPQIRVKINPTFVYNNLFGATTSQLTTNTVFLNFVKGLYVTFDQTQTTGGPGGNMFFNMGADSSSLDVYYHAIATDGTIDTEMVSWPLGNPHAVQIKHNYTAAAPALVAQLNNPTVSANTLYLQGLSGLRAKISFPYLKKIVQAQTALGGVILNRAELVVTPVTGTDVPFPPVQRLTMYRYDIALQRQLIPDAYSGDLSYIAVGSFGGYYDNYHKSYSFIITGYIQDLMLGKLVDYGTYLAPTDTTGTAAGAATISVTNTAQVASRAVVGGDKTSAYRMKLNIIYNKVVK